MKSNSLAPSNGRPVRPITTPVGVARGGSLAPNGLHPDRPQSAAPGVAPSGMMTQPQRGGGPDMAKPSTSPQMGQPKTVGRHTASPGLTPTSAPGGYNGPSMPPAGKMRSPGKQSGQKSATGPSAPVKSMKMVGRGTKK